MNITLLTYGSRGDVQPFVALALGLRRAGHQARLAAPGRFADLAASYGIPFAPLPGDPEEMSRRFNDSGRNVVGQVRGMTAYVASVARSVAQAAFASCDDADLIVHSFLFTSGAHSLARAKGIPDVSVQLFPMFAPTRAFPNVALARVPPGPLSAFTHRLATWIFWQGGKRLAPRGLLDFPLVWPFDPSRPIRTPLLFAYSPAVLPRPADWTAPHIHVTGYLFLDAPETYRPPPALVDFLAAGEPPVCVTFGSMVNREAARIDAVVRAALARTGRRGIVLTGWGGSQPAEPDADLFTLDAAPHDWLFPRCAAVIHHGGAGTTAAGLRAGIPNIVVPHAADQPFWAGRVAAIGAGPAPLDLKRLSVDSVSAALVQASAPEMRARAQEVGRLIRAEDGVGAAVRVIEVAKQE